MFKQLIKNVIVIAGASCLIACGNKGELFLPADVQLAQALEKLDVTEVQSTDEITDDEVFDEQKKELIGR